MISNLKFMKNEKVASSQIDQREEGSSRIASSAEAAQFEVFKNGSLDRATVAKWIRNDIESAVSLLNAARHEGLIFEAIVDAFYARYVSFHSDDSEDQAL